jgi:regulator of sigma E protease
MSILLFLAVLFVLVLVHEWGHFIVAKKTGMRVDEFGIGFPPKLYGKKWGETEYTLNALPLGGFVKIYGENGDEAHDAAAQKDSRAFGSRPKWAQALVLIAGVTMNVLFAWFLFSLTFMIGVPTAVDESIASNEAKLYIASTLPNAPIDGVVPVGGVIDSVSNGDVTLDSPTPTTFSDFVGSTAPEPVSITYTFNEITETVSVTPVAGLIADNPERFVIGTSLTLVETKQKGFLEAIGDGFITTMAGLGSIATGLVTLISQSVTGTADFTNIAGPVGIVGLVGDAAAFGVIALLTFTAVISLNLAVINMLPFPALDGGRLVFVCIEAITGKQIPAVWSGRVNLVGFALLMVLMVIVTYNDIVRLL